MYLANAYATGRNQICRKNWAKRLGKKIGTSPWLGTLLRERKLFASPTTGTGFTVDLQSSLLP